MQESITQEAPKPTSQAVLISSRMQLTLHATRRTPRGASRLVKAMSPWSVIIRRALFRHCTCCAGHKSIDSIMESSLGNCRTTKYNLKIGRRIKEYSLKSYLPLAGGRKGVANAVHLAGPERVHHTTSAIEVLPADASALVICELRWAGRVVGDSCAATARCAGHGVCSCV